MTLTPQISLGFDGRCEDALRYYEQHLGGRIVSLFTYANSPMAKDVPPDWGGKVMHATFAIGEALMAVSDVAPGRYERPRGFSVLLGVGDAGDAERIFHALADQGTVTVPMQETFWAVRFGAVVDRFGVPWSINCEQPPEKQVVEQVVSPR